METISTKIEKTPSHRRSVVGQAATRTLGIATTLTAIVLMTTSKEIIILFGFQMEAKYSYSPAFKFYVAANSVACFLSVISLSVFLYHVKLAKPGKQTYYIMFLLDLAVTICIAAGSSAATAIGYLGRYGNNHAGWMPICDHLVKFCHKAMTSLIFSYVAALIYLILTIYSSSKAIKAEVSIYEPENSLKRKEKKIENECASTS